MQLEKSIERIIQETVQKRVQEVTEEETKKTGDRIRKRLEEEIGIMAVTVASRIQLNAMSREVIISIKGGL